MYMTWFDTYRQHVVTFRVFHAFVVFDIEFSEEVEGQYGVQVNDDRC